ncbi:MAG: dCTP deaminase [bacterium]|nr:dCTP deaminase [bacterium]
MVLSDLRIAQLCEDSRMIDPFVPDQVRLEDGKRVISYGLSSYGYDVRIANEFWVFTNAFGGTVVDPKDFDTRAMTRVEVAHHEAVIIPPNSYVLGHSVEYFRVPRNVMTLCVGKSTYARCGIIVNVTPLEPGWEGHITIEISNAAPLPAKVYAGEGILQVIFFEGGPCRTSYADKQGKYQAQRGTSFARV